MRGSLPRRPEPRRATDIASRAPPHGPLEPPPQNSRSLKAGLPGRGRRDFGHRDEMSLDTHSNTTKDAGRTTRLNVLRIINEPQGE